MPNTRPDCSESKHWRGFAGILAFGERSRNSSIFDHSSMNTAQQKLNALGIDAVCERIGNGESMTAIAQNVGVAFGSLSAWLAADGERSARARDARQATARHWDEKAEAEIAAAIDPFSLSRAKELAHHYRWRASKIAPREYGDKLALGGADELPGFKLDGLDHGTLVELRNVIQSVATSGDVTR